MTVSTSQCDCEYICVTEYISVSLWVHMCHCGYISPPGRTERDWPSDVPTWAVWGQRAGRGTQHTPHHNTHCQSVLLCFTHSKHTDTSTGHTHTPLSWRYEGVYSIHTGITPSSIHIFRIQQILRVLFGFWNCYLVKSHLFPGDEYQRLKTAYTNKDFFRSRYLCIFCYLFYFAI